jgi:hypothetical protein
MVAVARVLSGNVELLLLDELFEGLAPTVVLALFTVFDKLRSHASVTVQHNLSLVPALADRPFSPSSGAPIAIGSRRAAAGRFGLAQADPLAVTKRACQPGRVPPIDWCASPTRQILAHLRPCPSPAHWSAFGSMTDARRETGADRVVVFDFTQRPTTSSAISGWPPPQRARRCRRRSCRKPRRP